MNYEEEAKNILKDYKSDFPFYHDLIVRIVKSLRKASGKIESQFKFGEHVLDITLGECIIISDGMLDGNALELHCYTVKSAEGAEIISHMNNIRPDPAYANTLNFLDHDGDYTRNGLGDFFIFYINSEGMVKGDRSDQVNWEHITKYAVVPEGWLD